MILISKIDFSFINFQRPLLYKFRTEVWLKVVRARRHFAFCGKTYQIEQGSVLKVLDTVLKTH